MAILGNVSENRRRKASENRSRVEGPARRESERAGTPLLPVRAPSSPVNLANFRSDYSQHPPASLFSRPLAKVTPMTTLRTYYVYTHPRKLWYLGGQLFADSDSPTCR